MTRGGSLSKRWAFPSEVTSSPNVVSGQPPAREEVPAVVVAGDDLLFSSRIAPRLHALGFRPLTVQTEEAFHDALRARPAAAILDLASRRFDSISAIGRAKAEATTRGIPLLGFCGHADTARREGARAAGCDLVASNGEVMGNLARLLTTLLGPRTVTRGQ